MNAPSVQEQRAIVLGDQLDAWKRSKIITAEEEKAADLALDTGWRTAGTLARIAFFIFGVIGVGCFFGLLDVFDVPGKGFVSAVAACGIAELLIRRKRLFHGGIEEGLFVAGLCAFIADLPGEGKVEAILLFAAAFAIAGARTRTALVALMAPLLVVAYLAQKADSLAAAGFVCLALGVAGSVLLLRPYASPFLEEVAVFSTVICPVVAYAMVAFDPEKEVRLATLVAAFGAVALVDWIVALRARSHPHLITALLLAAAVLFELSTRVSWTADVKLVTAGATALVLALAIDRWLREGARVTSTKILDPALIGAGEIVASAVVSSIAADASREVAAADGTPTHTGGGGKFGGAGASGEY